VTGEETIRSLIFTLTEDHTGILGIILVVSVVVAPMLVMTTSNRIKAMEILKDIIVTVKDGDLEIRRGKALTSLYYKGVEKFTFRTPELDILVEMIKAAKESANNP
jgi:hypothetical protein